MRLLNKTFSFNPVEFRTNHISSSRRRGFLCFFYPGVKYEWRAKLKSVMNRVTPGFLCRAPTMMIIKRGERRRSSSCSSQCACTWRTARVNLIEWLLKYQVAILANDHSSLHVLPRLDVGWLFCCISADTNVWVWPATMCSYWRCRFMWF